MAKHAPNYVVVAFLTLAAACTGSYVSHRQPHVSFDARLEALPVKIGDWSGHDVDLGSSVENSLAADHILSRVYTDAQIGRRVNLLVVYRKYGRRGFAHRPELCYPAAGWEIVQKAYTTVPYAGRDVQARVVIAEKNGRREAIAYWFASGRRTEANYVKQQARMALDRLQRQRYGWAFIRVNVPEWYGDEEALDLIRAFMKDAEKPLRMVLSGSN